MSNITNGQWFVYGIACARHRHAPDERRMSFGVLLSQLRAAGIEQEEGGLYRALYWLGSPPFLSRARWKLPP
jgi:hypothetical protein